MGTVVGIAAIVLFCIIVVWPLLTYLGDAVRWFNDRGR